MNKNYAKFYTDFERPPFAPTFYPTEEEFADPITYVAKIKPEAEKYGVVKIKPPPSFRPPFAIDSETFHFTPRIQKLNQIEALSRARLIFDAQLASYWHMQGHTLQVPTIDNKYVDFYSLYKTVMEAGGESAVSAQKRWSHVTKRLGFKQQRVNKIKNVYFKWIDSFQKSINENGGDEENKNCDGCSTMNNTGNGHVEQGRRRIPQPRTKSMAGRHHTKEKKMKTADPMDAVVCKKCGKGDDEEHLLLCEECDYALHIYCCTPALQSVPKAEWRCHQCVLASVKEIADSYAFHDAHTSYNLLTFAKYANDWKSNYFHKDPLEIPCEEVEQAFWKNVIDLENTIAVKYGADLLVTKVGSGFPMNGFDFGGVMDPKERHFYANHPWNLNNLPVLKDSVLCHMGTGISGMMVPWVYVGMCFSAFCWHTEDHWTYSVNYMHWGERKIWYGVSGNEGEKFDKVMMELVPYLFERQPDLLHHMTTTLNPKVLISKGVHVYTVHQEPGEFVITFPRSYHAGYNEGLNFAEAVNFAPADWLRKGRFCIFDYARVHRNCVFSHEELMIKMAKCHEELGVGVRVAVHEELYEIINREKLLREVITRKQITKSERVEYENIPDDFRSCMVCKTTLFMSALTCKHKRLVCLEHADRICTTCTAEDLTLNYRYTPDELVVLYDTLSYEIRDFTSWKDKLMSMLNVRGKSSPKPMLEDLRALVNVSKMRRFPHFEGMDQAMDIIKRCDAVVQTAHLVMSRRIRTRNNLLKHVNDCPVNIRDVETLEKTIDQLPCSLPNLEIRVKNYSKRLLDWRKRCSQFMKSAVDLTEKYESYVEPVKKLIEEADDFNVNLVEIDDLEKMRCKCQWLKSANKLLTWTQGKETASESEDESVENNGRSNKNKWKLEKVMSLIEEGATYAETDYKFQSKVDDLHVMMKTGYQNEYAAKSFLEDSSNEGIGMERAEKLWVILELSGWMTEENIDKFRSEYKLGGIIHHVFRHIRDNGSYTLKSLNELLNKVSKSFIMKNSPVHIEIQKLRECVQCFCTRVNQMFVQSPSYYSIVEILSGRDDLAELIEGVPMPLSPLESRSPREDWAYVENFATVGQLEHHVDALYEQQRRLMTALRKTNETRPLNETCSCGSAKAENDAYIQCLLCRAKFHSTCVQWNSFMAQLPVGYYLCVRCLRSRRPFIEDVQGACATATPSLEWVLVKNVLKHAELAYKEALDLIGTLPDSDTALTPEQCQSVDECLISVFCNEIMHSDAWKLIMGALVRVKPPSEKDKEIYEQIKRRPVSAQISNVLFPDSNDGKKCRGLKRSSSGIKSIAGHRKRSKNDFHMEQEICSAAICLKPYSDHIRWIQCEAGCQRWYHYVCVGQTVRQAQQTTSYCCNECSKKTTVKEPKLSPPSSTEGSA